MRESGREPRSTKRTPTTDSTHPPAKWVYFPSGPAAERYRAERRTQGNGVYMHITETQDRGVCHIHTAALACEQAHSPIQWG